MRRVLILASVASMIDQFNLPNIKLLQELGYTVDVACNFIEGNTCTDEKIAALKETLAEMNVTCYQVDFSRDIKKIKSVLKALKQVQEILQSNSYEFIHCHSPIGGVVGRLAGKLAKTKVIYTAHGFHFYKGAPLKNWLIYYPVEWFFAHWTHTLITINQEDYVLAQKRMYAKNVVYVPGIGMDLKKFDCSIIEAIDKRAEVGVSADMVWLLSVGELIARKNHETLIRAIVDVPNVYLTIAGRGELQEYLTELIKELHLENRVQMLGFRTDISELCNAVDVFCMPSVQEGLPVALMEAMASGLPIVCSDIRGNRDLIDQNGGFLFEATSVEECKRALEHVLVSDRDELSRYNREKIKGFSSEAVQECMTQIYTNI